MPCISARVVVGNFHERSEVGNVPADRFAIARCLLFTVIFWTALFVCVVSEAATNQAPQAPASDYIVRNWSTDDGLPQNSVTAIAQTRDGYLWLGTFNGLVRFDGVRCRLDTFADLAVGRLV
jgi:hypothetical protein